MFFNATKFEVVHSGRGGHISFLLKGKKEQFNIEMGSEGSFLIFSGKDVKFEKIKIELIKFLNETKRTGWVICE